MKKKQIVKIVLLIMIFFPISVFTSGVVKRSSVSGFVYVEDYAGLKSHKGSPQMMENARSANKSRGQILQERVDSIAKKVQNALENYVKTSKTKVKFEKIEKGYQLHSENMSGTTKFLTIKLDEKTVKYVGKKCNLHIKEYPQVVLRFSKLPNIKQLNIFKKVVEKTVKDSE